MDIQRHNESDARQAMQLSTGGGRQTLMDRPNVPIRNSEGLARPRDVRVRRLQGRERGQAMVEFALILFPLLILVAGIIQFGIGLNYWLDMNRIANQGARWAAVNCARGAQTPPTYNPCDPALEDTLKDQAVTSGLKSSVCVTISFPSGTSGFGDPVKVELESPFTFVPLLGLGTITLSAEATMRMEQAPTAFTAASTCP